MAFAYKAQSASTEPSGLSQNEINDVIRNHRNELKDCFRAKVITHFKIEGNGSISNVGIKESMIDSEGFNQCLMNAIKTWNFPQKGISTEVTSYPFYLNSQKD